MLANSHLACERVLFPFKQSKLSSSDLQDTSQKLMVDKMVPLSDRERTRTFQFIEEIQNYEYLWDKSSKGYKDTENKHKIMEVITGISGNIPFSPYLSIFPSLSVFSLSSVSLHYGSHSCKLASAYVAMTCV